MGLPEENHGSLKSPRIFARMVGGASVVTIATMAATAGVTLLPSVTEAAPCQPTRTFPRRWKILSRMLSIGTAVGVGSIAALIAAGVGVPPLAPLVLAQSSVIRQKGVGGDFAARVGWIDAALRERYKKPKIFGRSSGPFRICTASALKYAIQMRHLP